MSTKFEINDAWERRWATKSVRTRIVDTFDETISDMKRRVEELERAKKAALEYFDDAVNAIENEADIDEARKAGGFCTRYLSSTVFDLSRNNNSRLDMFAKAEIGVTALFDICPF